MNNTRYRGHLIEEIDHDLYVYSDTRQPVSENKNRRCGWCERENRSDGNDSCLTELNGLINACCGHGNIYQAYVQFYDNTSVHGKDAITIQEILKRSKE